MSKFLGVCLTLLLTLPVLVWAQQPGSLQDLPPLAQGLAPRYMPAAGANDGLIHFDVVVTDRSGKPVTGLEARDFTLLDNGQPAKILSFQASDGFTAKPDPVVEVDLLLDQLNLAPDQASTAEREIDKFLRRNGGHLAQPALVYVLSNDGLAATSGPSTDGNAVAAELASKKTMRPLWPGLIFYQMERVRQIQSFNLRNYLSLSALGSIAIEERKKPGRKLLLWLGYGWPVGAACEDAFDWITEFSTRLREARVAVSSVSSWPYPIADFYYQGYVKGVKTARQQNSFALSLQVLAVQSGGRVLELSSDLAGQVDAEIRNSGAYYTLSFDPPPTEQTDEYHELIVQTRNPGQTARASTGYYDQPVYYDQPSPPARRVTVEQLEQLLGAVLRSSDGDVARQLSSLELTERMSSASLLSWKARMPGEKSRASLELLVDASAFLTPPPEKIPSSPAPDLATQRMMLSKTVDYLGKTIPRLPNFFATRTTVRYREPLQKEEQTWKTATGDRLLHLSGSSSTTVLYRNGYDVADSGMQKGKDGLADQKLNDVDMSAFGPRAKVPKGEERSMNTKGTFGPILSTVILDAAQSTLSWSRWEQGTSGVRAIFRYAVLEEKSHYEVAYCCLQEGDGTTVFRRLSGYHGEIRIDPDSGAILRLTVEADLEATAPPRLPIVRSDILVEYAPQEIGGTTYICPVRSVSIWRGRRGEMVHEWGESFRVYGPFETMLDDVSFTQYHLFRGEARVLTGDETPPEK